jgi:hypothetical protein
MAKKANKIPPKKAKKTKGPNPITPEQFCPPPLDGKNKPKSKTKSAKKPTTKSAKKR